MIKLLQVDQIVRTNWIRLGGANLSPGSDEFGADTVRVCGEAFNSTPGEVGTARGEAWGQRRGEESGRAAGTEA